MADRRVRGTGKDDEGDITSLCGDWGEVTKAEALRHITPPTTHTYYVQEGGLPRVEVTEADGHLRTTPDGNSANNLDNLPDC